MRKSKIATGSVLICIAFLALAFSAAEMHQEVEPVPTVKNIILMIGDGMGYNHVEAASLYRFGRPGGQVYTGFPVALSMSTYSVSGQGYDPQRAWSDFEYVKSGYTDSAAAATAMATGVKTTNWFIGIDPDKQPLKNVANASETAGKATGLVTSVPISHATPAGFSAHNENRYDFEGIASEMLNDSGLDVLMGVGHPDYDDDGVETVDPKEYRYVGGAELWLAIKGGKAGGDCDGDGEPDPWKLVETREDILSLREGAAPKRVLALARVHRTFQQRRGTPDGNAADDLPYQVPLNKGIPTLAEMTSAALNVLDEDPDGFFLMIEGGAIDWAAEHNESGRLVEEQIDFDRAVEAVIEWVEQNSNWDETILIVTADHEAGYLLGPDSDPEWKPLVDNGKDKLPGMEWHSTSHTNSLVPLYAKGRSAVLLEKYADETDPVRGRYVDNTEIAKVIFASIGKSEQQ